MKKNALALRIIGGPTAYRLLQKNLGAPSLSTVDRTLSKTFTAKEGQLLVDETLRAI